MKKIGIITILFTSNNIICTLMNSTGSLLIWTSTGSKKLKGSKKLNLVGVSSTILELVDYTLKFGLINIYLQFKGFSKYKKLVIKFLTQSNLKVSSIKDFTSPPHNGCRQKSFKRL